MTRLKEQLPPPHMGIEISEGTRVMARTGEKGTVVGVYFGWCDIDMDDGTKISTLKAIGMMEAKRYLDNEVIL